MALECNRVKCGGYLISKNIMLGVNKETRKNWMMGQLKLRIAENQEVDLTIFANEFTSTGSANKSYQALKTIKDEYKSLDSTITNKRMNSDAKPEKDEATTVGSLEECDFVYANKGIKISMNHYMRDGQLNSNFRLSVNFVNRAKETDAKEPYLEGELIGVVSKVPVVLEDNDGEYIKFELTVPEYRNAWGDREESVVVDKFEIVMKKEDFNSDDEFEGAKDFVESEFEENVVVSTSIVPTVKVVAVEEETPTSKRGFGKKVEFTPSTKVVREIRAIGGFPLEEEEYEGDNAFNLELYSKGVEEYERKLEELKQDQPKDFTAHKGFGKKTSTDLPF